MHTNNLRICVPEEKMTTVKNQFVVGLEGCESKGPWLVTLPGGKAQSEGERSNSKSILTEFHLPSMPKHHLQFKACFPLKVTGGHVLRDTHPASLSTISDTESTKTAKTSWVASMFTADSHASTKNNTHGCLQGDLSFSKTYKCKHYV